MRQTMSHGRAWVRFVLASWGVLCAVALSGRLASAADPGLAGNFVELTEFDGQKITTPTAADRSTAGTVIREGVIPAESKASFDNTLRYRLAELTKVNQHDVRENPAFKRIDIKKQLISASKAADPAAHKYMVKFFSEALPKIALDKQYHPISRYNAMLLLGNLDDKESDAKGEGAEPRATVRPVLISTIGDKNLPDSIRLAALMGLVRHAELSSGSIGADAVTVLVKIVDAPKSDSGVDADGHAWMRRTAAQGLATIIARRSPDISPAMITALGKLLTDRDATIMARSDAALALAGATKSQLEAARVDVKQLLFGCAQLATDIGKVAGNQQATLEPEWAAYCLSAVKLALQGNESGQGILPVATGDAQAMGNELAGFVDGMLRAATMKNAEQLAVRQQLQARGDEVARWLKAKGGDTPAPGAATAARS